MTNDIYQWITICINLLLVIPVVYIIEDKLHPYKKIIKNITNFFNFIKKIIRNIKMFFLWKKILRTKPKRFKLEKNVIGFKKDGITINGNDYFYSKQKNKKQIINIFILLKEYKKEIRNINIYNYPKDDFFKKYKKGIKLLHNKDMNALEMFNIINEHYVNNIKKELDDILFKK